MEETNCQIPQWNSKRRVSGTHTEFVHTNIDRAGAARCREAGSIQFDQFNFAAVACSDSSIPIHCMQLDRISILAVHMLYDAVHTEVSVDVQRMDV